MLDDVKLIIYMKFQKFLMTGSRDSDRNIKNTPEMVFPPFVTPKDRALPLLYPYGALASCKKLEKNNERSLRYLKTDQRTDGRTTDGRTDKGDYQGTPQEKPGSKMLG